MPGGGALPLPPGAWTLTEPTPDGPKTPERAEILDLLKASAAPMSPKQIADALRKHSSTIRSILVKMVQDGDIKMVGYGKYLPADSVDSVDSSIIKKKDTRNEDTLFDMKESIPTSKASTLSTLSAGDGESDPEPAVDAIVAAPLAAPPTQAAAIVAAPRVPPPSRRPTAALRPTSPLKANGSGAPTLSRRDGGGTSDDLPPADFTRFAQTVADATGSRLDESSPRQDSDAAAPGSLYNFMAMAMPDAHDPYTLQPSGPRCASQSSAGKGRHAGAGCAAWRAKTDGETMKG